MSENDRRHSGSRWEPAGAGADASDDDASTGTVPPDDRPTEEVAAPGAAPDDAPTAVHAPAATAATPGPTVPVPAHGTTTPASPGPTAAHGAGRSTGSPRRRRRGRVIAAAAGLFLVGGVAGFGIGQAVADGGPTAGGTAAQEHRHGGPRGGLDDRRVPSGTGTTGSST